MSFAHWLLDLKESSWAKHEYHAREDFARGWDWAVNERKLGKSNIEIESQITYLKDDKTMFDQGALGALSTFHAFHE